MYTIQQSSACTERRDSPASDFLSAPSLPSSLRCSGQTDKSLLKCGSPMAIDNLCFSSDDAAMASALSCDSETHSTSTVSTIESTSPSISLRPPSQLPPSFSPYTSLRSSPSLDLSSDITSSPTPAPLLPWWRRLLDALWMAAKMSVMFTLVSVLWLILAVPTIDQKLHALFSFLRRHLAMSSSKCTQSRPRGSTKASQLQFDDDDHSTNGEEKAQRLTGSQELKKSEEGDNKKEEEAAPEAKEEAAGKGEEEPKEQQQQEAESETSSAMKSKRKRIVKSVRWSDDASQE